MNAPVRPKSVLSMLIYRQLLRGPKIQLDIEGQHYEIQPGDFIEGALFMRFDQDVLDRLGPPVKRQAIETRFKTSIGQDQLVFRPMDLAAAKPEPTGAFAPMASVDASNVKVIRLGRLDPLKFLAGELAGIDPSCDVLLVDEDVLLPWGDLETAVMLAVTRRSNLPLGFVFPAMNLHDPVSLPMAGDHSSSLSRLPGGQSVWELATALANTDLQPQAGWPARPGCVLTSHFLASKMATGERQTAAGRSLVDPRVFAYRDADHEGPLAQLLDGEGGFSSHWPNIAREAYLAVAAAPKGPRPPVVFYSTTVGPWGGVAVLFRLADELQQLGVHAFVACEVDQAHGFRPKTPPLRVPAGVLVNDWKRIVGDEAILVASHWGSGKLAKAVKTAHSEVIVTSILQDREDLFETTDGRKIPREDFQDYLDIGRGRSVSRWIIESAATDLGIELGTDTLFDNKDRLNLPKAYDVIPNGIDLNVFKPGNRLPDDGRPIRVLAMWRPQTEIRRGIALLRKTYDHLHQTFGAGVSLEVFGWNAPEGMGKAPSYVKHHGHLSHAQVAALMGEVDIVVEPSLFQGWSLSATEGLACGAAVVSTNCLGPSEFIAHGQNALMVPHDDLPGAVEEVVRDGELRQRLQAAARPSVEALNWKVIGAQWALYLAGLYRDSARSARAEQYRDLEGRASEVLSKAPPRPEGLQCVSTATISSVLALRGTR